MASTSQAPGSFPLVGRERELAAVATVLSRDDSSVLLLRGPAGIGKTALLEAARRQARTFGYRVLSTAGSLAESSFAFAGLQPLLLPLVNEDVGLPKHLSSALRSALGLLDDQIPGLETVALAMLGLLGGVASQADPLCLVVDDVHWLDPPTVAVLQFVVRRLAADPVVVVAASREGGPLPVGEWPEVQVEPLAPAAVTALLQAQAPDLAAAVRTRIVVEAQGNPLALVELPRAASAALQDGRSALQQVPLTDRLEAAFTQRMQALGVDEQAVLVTAALAPTASLVEVLTAAGLAVGHDVGLAALDRAVALGLVALDGQQIHFRHPLVRSGLVQATALSRRRATHEALARVLPDPERCLQHRAEAHVGYDDELADALEEAAGQALRRGTPATAVAAVEQSAALTAPGPRRAGRLVRAATMSFELGQTDEAHRLLRQIEGAALGRRDHAMARLVAAAADRSDNDDPAPVWELVGLARESIAADDDDTALRLLEFASTRVSWGEPGRELGRAIVGTARLVRSFATDPRVTALLAHAMPVEGHLELEGRLRDVDERDLAGAESLRLVGFAAVIAGDYEQGDRLLVRAERQLRDEARLAALAMVLTFRGVAANGSGQWLLAAEILDEAERLASETNQPAWLNRVRLLRAGLTGMSGDEERHREIVRERTLTYQRTQAVHGSTQLTVMQGKAAAMTGRADTAVSVLGGLFDRADPGFDARAAYEVVYFLADAAATTNRFDVMQRAIEAMAEAVPAPWPPILQSGVDYARAVMASEAELKQRLFDAALAGPAGERPFDRARVQLAYGSWLRRRNARAEAREQLRQARGTFEQLGNLPFARRATDELRASGEVDGARPGATSWDTLSPQELQIARLVAEGLSNKEIGERLFLSHRTIGSHLYRMFPKLGVASRSQLASVIPAQGRAGPRAGTPAG